MISFLHFACGDVLNTTQIQSGLGTWVYELSMDLWWWKFHKLHIWGMGNHSNSVKILISKHLQVSVVSHYLSVPIQKTWWCWWMFLKLLQ